LILIFLIEFISREKDFISIFDCPRFPYTVLEKLHQQQQSFFAMKKTRQALKEAWYKSCEECK